MVRFAGLAFCLSRLCFLVVCDRCAVVFGSYWVATVADIALKSS